MTTSGEDTEAVAGAPTADGSVPDGLAPGFARWLARQRRLPTSLRAVAGYYGRTRRFDPDAIRLKRRVDDVTEQMVADAFEPVEVALADAFDADGAAFDYDTKLILPAQLTLGECYRRAGDASADADRARANADQPGGDDPTIDVDAAEATTRLAVEALIEGDLRDAINDDEYDDVDVTVGGAPVPDRARAARVARDALRERVEERFEEFDPAVRDAYDVAVEHSEAHQDRDATYRDLLRRARDGDTDAAQAIADRYKLADFERPPPTFDAADLALPYAKTQYARVGVLYRGMLEMYRAAGIPVDDDFERAVVLAIVGAQIWLDDVDDYRHDVADDQLTPVTAEYALADDERVAREAVVEITERYLNRARAAATAADSDLTGIAVEYIYRSGTPEDLPP